MALKGNGKPFGLDVEGRLKGVAQNEHTHVHEHVHNAKPSVKERKTFRAHILTYPSLIARLDKYAEAHGLSRAEVFEMAVTDFLDKNE